MYYQLVAQHGLPNRQSEYKRLGEVLANARMAGLVSWTAIEDRTRNLETRAAWESPQDIIDDTARAYHIDLWEGQNYRPYVWVEKDALVGVVEHACQPLDVGYFSCRGYTSLSEMWAQAMRMIQDVRDRHQQPVVIHLGDHDPSGLDMSRDIEERLDRFIGAHLPGKYVVFERVALNMPQIREYDPPPNPAKKTDARFAGYAELHGDESWELDALRPDVLNGIITEAVDRYRNQALFDVRRRQLERERKSLWRVSRSWEDVIPALDYWQGETETEEEEGELGL